MPPKRSATKVADAPVPATRPSRARTTKTESSSAKAVEAAAESKPKSTKAKSSSTIAKAASKKAATTKKEPTTNGNVTDASTDGPKEKPSRKRKADENEEPARKKVKPEQSEKPARKKATPSAPVSTRPKGPRVTTVINHAPTEVLDVYVFGTGENGELGLGNGKNTTTVKRPRLNPHLASDQVGVVQVAVGGMHTAVLTKDNKILTWGVNDQGALGRDTNWDGGLKDMDAAESDDESDVGANLNPKESTPGEVDLGDVPEDTTWTQVVAADSATFALTSTGLVYGCGTFRKNEGILGFSPTTLIQRTLTLIPTLRKITQLCAGANHILALQSTGAVYAWGAGQQNQLGRRMVADHDSNGLVPTGCGLPKAIETLGAGSYHSFAVHRDGRLFAWGLNSFGEAGLPKDFGDESGPDANLAEVVPGLGKFGKITHIEGGAHHSIAMTDKGEVLVWGRLDGSQLGIDVSSLPDEALVKDANGNKRILQTPTQVPNIVGASVAAGTDHSLLVTKDGKAFSCGFSASYQTGQGTDDDVEEFEHIDNTAVREKKLVWAGCGGQFSVLAGAAEVAGSAVQMNGA